MGYYLDDVEVAEDYFASISNYGACGMYDTTLTEFNGAHDLVVAEIYVFVRHLL